MKTSQIAVVSAITLALGTLAAPQVFAQNSTAVPFGTLTASPTVVQSGTKTTLTWNISYPAAVLDYVGVTFPGTVTPKQDLICDIRILGAGVTTQDSKGNIVFIRTKGLVRYNTSSTSNSWTTIFDGTQLNTIVQQQGIIASFPVAANKPIDFGGQYYYGGWSSFRSSASGTYVKALVDGDPCPSRIPDYNAPSLEKFLKPYLDSTNRVHIGPMDVIIFMELTHSSTSSIGYDEQDLVFLVSFRKP